MMSIQKVVEKVDNLIVQSQLNALSLLVNSDHSDRLMRVAKAILRLNPGAYLLGTGPAMHGIIPLTVEEIVLGRLEMPGEEMTEILVDCYVNDTVYFSPNEVSRSHAKIVKDDTRNGLQFRVIDLQSSCGTYVNAELLTPGEPGRLLEPHDVIALGSSHVNTFLFYIKASE